ncbi:glycosyl transferase family protein [Legionella wadsworthii]|uniref:Glycosyl transferase family protein n=1 Tax=Legionella wadsworthii TaxID=28088 RepID=A0A378LS47_9GAMM|nr:glycosyltransferase family 2 protein [Legionella wadsworthii]STY29517.1 glycosyl transferase family protein [Legionella wadsworthii]
MIFSISEFIFFINIAIIWFYLVINAFYLFLLITSIPDVLLRFQEAKRKNIEFLSDSRILPSVTALVPAYNEEKVITNTVQSLLRSNYPNLKIIVINDGATDNTLPFLKKDFDLIDVFLTFSKKIKTIAEVKGFYQSKKYANLIVIDKEHSGKADSLNVGVNLCNTPLLMSIDADTLLEPDAIPILVFSMLSKPHTIAEGGAVYILNGCKYKDGELIDPKMSSSTIEAIQSCEYLRAFLFGRTGWKPFRGPLVLAGALTMLERQAVLTVGGYNVQAPGEDMEIIVSLHEYMRIHNYPYRIGYSFSAAAWTHCPSNMIALWSQRARWHRGLIDSLFRHKKLLFNYKFGATGLLSYPFLFIAEFLGPIIEFFGYIAVALSMYFNIINWKMALLFFIATAGFSGMITIGTTLISIISFDKYQRTIDIILQLFLAVFENLGYRQLLALCRVTTTFRYFLSQLIYKEKPNKSQTW